MTYDGGSCGFEDSCLERRPETRFAGSGMKADPGLSGGFEIGGATARLPNPDPHEARPAGKL